MDTRQVIERHIAALLDGDVDAMMDTFAQDAVVLGGDGRPPLATRDEIREGCERLVQGLFAPGTYAFHLDSIATVGEVGLVTWHARCQGTDIPFAADSFVVRDGAIVSKTFAVVLQEV